MRVVVLGFRLLAVAVVGSLAFLLARHLGHRRPTAPDLASEQSYGGEVNADSIRAVRAAILRRVTGPDSYIPAMLVEGDSMLRRWPESRRPLRVYLAPGRVEGYRDELRDAGRAAFVRWEQVGGIPVHFTFVTDSTNADVLVRWIERFSMRRAGQADIRWNGAGWIANATLTLATYTSDGLLLDRDAVYTVALHEIGHLLGLGHSDDPKDVMFPTTSVHDITVRDRNTARLLYSVPPGPLRLSGQAAGRSGG